MKLNMYVYEHTKKELINKFKIVNFLTITTTTTNVKLTNHT